MFAPIAEQPWFNQGQDLSKTKQQAVRGAVVTLLFKLAMLAVSLVSLIVLARLLSPGEFGVLAMAGALTGFLGLIQDMGAGSAIVRSADLNSEQTSNLFWICFSSSLVLFVLMLILAGYAASWYDEPRVELAVQLSAVGVLLKGLQVGHMGLLVRAMAFQQLSIAALLNTVITVLVSISMALVQPDFTALIWGVLAGVVSNLVLAWRYCSWRPGGWQFGVGTWGLLVDGWRLLLFRVLGFGAGNVHMVALGAMHGAATVGLYGRAERLYNLILDQLMGVAGLVAPPSMSRLQKDPPQYAHAYLQGVRLAVLLILPPTFVGITLGQELVEVLLGSNWYESAWIFQSLCAGLVPAVLLHSYGWVYLSGGDLQGMMRWGVFGWSVVIVGMGLTAALYDVQTLAMVAPALSWVLVLPGMHYAYKSTNINAAKLWVGLWPLLLTAVVACLFGWLATHWVVNSTAWERLIIGTTGFLAVYVGVVICWPEQRMLVLNVVRLARGR